MKSFSSSDYGYIVKLQDINSVTDSSIGLAIRKIAKTLHFYMGGK